MPTPNPVISTREEYNALAALNYSGAKELLKSPAHYQAYLAADREETKALRMGSLTHAMVLEADTVSHKYAAAPECDRRTKEGKQLYDIFMTANAGKKVIPSDEWTVCDEVSGSMRRRMKAMRFEITATEVMLTTDYCGAQLKSALDAIVTDDNGDEWIVDLKTSEDASAKGFMQSVRSFRYNLQAHFYRMVYQAATRKTVKGFVFIVAEKSPPYLSAAYVLGPELMTYAALDFEQAVATYKSCVALDIWPGYPDEIQTLDIPSKTSANPITFA